MLESLKDFPIFWANQGLCGFDSGNHACTTGPDGPRGEYMSNNVIGQILGGEKKILDGVYTVGDCAKMLGATNHTPSINGITAGPNDAVQEGDFVSFAPAVKGGC